MTTSEPSTIVALGSPRGAPSGAIVRHWARGPAEIVLVFGVLLAIGTQLGASLLFLLTTALIFSLFAMSVNVLFGWTGMASFGQAAYFGIGAFTVALAKDADVSPVLLVLAGAVIAGLVAAVFSVLAVRVSGVEFAMLTLVFGQILYLVTFRIDALGGENGIPGIGRGEILSVPLSNQMSFLIYVAVVVGLSFMALDHVASSSFGGAMSAVRDDPLRAAALGIPVKTVRILAFVVAGVAGGIAGGLFAQQLTIVSNLSLFWLLSGNGIIMCLIGGMRRFWGPALGALIFTGADWYLRQRYSAPILYLGTVFLVIVLVLPEGLAGLPDRVAAIWSRRQRAGSGGA